MRKYTTWILLLLTGFAGSVQAQEKQMSLKECIQYSLTHHGSVQVYKNEVAIAKARATEAVSGYLPQVNASTTFDDNIKRQTTVIPGGAFSPTDIKLQFGNQYNFGASLQVEQTIFDQTQIAGLGAIKPNNAMATINVQRNEQHLIYNTAAAYYQALTAQEQEKLLAENEKKYRDLLGVMKLQLEKGVITKLDFNRVQLSLNNITAQKQILSTNKLLALNRLKVATGLPLESPLNLADSINTKAEVTLPEDIAFQPGNNLDLQFQTQTLALQKVDLRRKQAAFLPSISGYARYGAQSFGNEFAKATDNWFDFSAIGLRMNLPIFGGLRRTSQLTQAELNLRDAKINLGLMSENLKLQQQNAQTQLLSSYTNLSNNRSTLGLAREVFEMTTLQYAKGVATMADFLNADYAYKEAQTNYAASLLNFLTARLEYEKANGTLKNYADKL